MSYSELNQLSRAEELFNQGNLEEALEILNDESHFEGLSLQQKSYFQFLKGLILLYLNKGEDLISLGETIYKEGQKCNDNLQSCDGLIFIIIGLAITKKFKEALQIVLELEQGDDLSLKELFSHKLVKANLLQLLGNHLDAIEIAKEIFQEFQKLGDFVSSFDAILIQAYSYMMMVNSFEYI